MKREELEQYAKCCRLIRDTEFLRRTRQFWLAERTKLISQGKKHRREEDWAELDGFDKAVLIVERGFAYELEEHNKVESPDPTSED